ncbi:MAG: sulfate ABC transporter permease subunit CysT [Bacillota bacterium]
MGNWKGSTSRLGWWMLGSTAIGYIIILVLLPVGAIFSRAMQNGLGGLWADLAQPPAVQALVLTLKVAFAGAVINSVMGLITAYVLVRFEFRGKSILNSLVDLPFAIPTAVSGLMLVAIYGSQSPIGKFLETAGIQVSYAVPGIIIAILLVTFPFTIRAVQPVLEEFDMEMEEAAYNLGANPWQTFWGVTLPSIFPGVLAGFTLAFARALAEFGAVVVVAGNIPMQTQLAAVYVYGEMESYNPRGATSISLVLLLLAVVLLLLLNYLSRQKDPNKVFMGGLRTAAMRLKGWKASGKNNRPI